MESFDTPGIPEFYARKSIFLTGATGFLGKVLIEKILRCCPDVECIYCLIRPKRGCSAKERLEKMFSERLYEKLKEEQPDFADKVHPIHGDIMEEELGIKDEDKKLLAEKVEIVFHSAATIKFDEPLKKALQMNVLAVRKMIHLCKTFDKLQVFLHVSTAYANCDRKNIEEVIYPPPIEPQKILDAAEWMDEEMMNIITPQIIRGKPNTYTFTKQLAEHMLVTEGKDLPLAIVRPSIVTAAWKEPVPGWIDNLNGPSGLYIAAGKGIMRTLHADHSSVADMIPVDLPTNLMIAVAWYTAVVKPKEVLLYHSTTGTLNHITWGEMANVVRKYINRVPFDECFRRPNCTLTTNNFLHEYWTLVSHMIPAYLTDLGFRLIGKKPRMVHIYGKLHKAMQTLNFFTMREWMWTHNNQDMLKSQMSPQDQQIFYFDPRGLHWQSYLETYVLGTKTFILKEDLKDVNTARAHIKRLRNIRYTFNTLLLILLWRLLIARSNLARNSWYFVMGLVFKFVRFFRITSTIQSK